MIQRNLVHERKSETKHIVAFLDLLGASEFIKGEESENILNLVSEVFDLARKHWLNQEGFEMFSKIKTAIFSDNIAFSLEIPQKASASESVANLKIPEIVATTVFVSYISIFQAIALSHGLLFRGGITIGPLYMDQSKNFIWGKALLEAYMLEKDVAIYPRIVLSHQIENLFENLAVKLSEIANIKKDFDGQNFVDYLTTITSRKENLIEMARAMIRSAYANADYHESIGKLGQERIVQKYAWLQHYIEQQ